MPSWLTSNEEAARHPWKVRVFLFVGFTILVPIVFAVAGAGIRDNLTTTAVLALAVGAAGTLLVERTSSSKAVARPASTARRLAESRYTILVIFAAAVILAIAVNSPLPLAVLLPLAVAALPLRRP
jgi:hypothetical protein